LVLAGFVCEGEESEVVVVVAAEQEPHPGVTGEGRD
jgi:hypothetical protein